jgi:hypothetical protein
MVKDISKINEIIDRLYKLEADIKKSQQSLKIKSTQYF